ncbi:MAG: flagellar export protein FliJ [Phycisphaerae bacterium]
MAKRFRFQLETVLRVRELRQQEAARHLAEKRAEIARVEQLIDDTHHEVDVRQAELLSAQQSESIDAGLLVRCRAWIGQLRRNIAQFQHARAQLSQQYEQLAGVWRQARTQTRILEKLRERRLDEHKHVERRREQADADELAQQLQLRKRA